MYSRTWVVERITALRGVALVASALLLLSLAACGNGAPEETPPTNPPATQPPQPTEERPSQPSSIEEPENVTVQGPPGAGLIEPLHELRPETARGDLEPGDYAVVWDLLASEEAGFELYDYVLMDGDADGPLFQIIPLFQQDAIPDVVSIDEGRVVARSDGEGPSGSNTLLTFVDQGQGAFQFALDDEGSCRLPRAPGFVGERYFGYHCENDEGSLTWYAVDIENWQFAAEVPLPPNVRMKGWLSPEMAYFGTPYDRTRDTFVHCQASARDWALGCAEYPFWVGGLNPQETTFWGWPSDIERYDTVAAAIPADCILELRPECTSVVLDLPEEFQDDFTADLAASAWAPVARKLITVAANCREDLTRLWYWDFEAELPFAVAEIDGCYSLPLVGPLWDSSGSIMILETGDPDTPPLLVSLDGTIIEDLPVPGSAVGVFSRP